MTTPKRTPRTLQDHLNARRSQMNVKLPTYLWFVALVAALAIVLDLIAWGNSGAWMLGVGAILAVVGFWAWKKFIFKAGDE